MGGIIFDPGENIVTSFTWGIRHKFNHEAEWLSLYLGLELAGWNNIAKIIVFGDPKHVIQKMRKGYNHGVVNCKRMYDRICCNNLALHASYYHILGGNNFIVDKLANQGVKKILGLVSIKGHHNYHKHIP